MKIVNSLFEMAEQFRYLEKTVMKILIRKTLRAD